MKFYGYIYNNISSKTYPYFKTIYEGVWVMQEGSTLLHYQSNTTKDSMFSTFNKYTIYTNWQYLKNIQ